MALGIAKGKITITDDFIEPIDDLFEVFKLNILLILIFLFGILLEMRNYQKNILKSLKMKAILFI